VLVISRLWVLDLPQPEMLAEKVEAASDGVKADGNGRFENG